MQMFVSNVSIYAASEGASEGGGADLLIPAVEELIAGIIAFAIILFFVWKWVFPQLAKTLEARQAAVTAGIEAAEAAKVEAEKFRNDYRDQLSDAQNEANRIVEEARQAGEAVRADIVSKAEQEAESIKSRTRADLLGDRERATTEIRREMASLSLDIAEKVIGASLDREGQQALVEQYIEDLEGVEG